MQNHRAGLPLLHRAVAGRHDGSAGRRTRGGVRVPPPLRPAGLPRHLQPGRPAGGVLQPTEGWFHRQRHLRQRHTGRSYQGGSSVSTKHTHLKVNVIDLQQ